jgi:hypothetical protein
MACVSLLVGAGRRVGEAPVPLPYVGEARVLLPMPTNALEQGAPLRRGREAPGGWLQPPSCCAPHGGDRQGVGGVQTRDTLAAMMASRPR